MKDKTICSQCGQPFSAPSCGPTHAIHAQEEKRAEQPPAPVSVGAAEIHRERLRQLLEENWSAAHDDQHDAGELSQAAACYAHIAHMLCAGAEFNEALRAKYLDYATSFPIWPWHDDWWKPSDDPIRNLEKAGALAAAEIDRLTRLYIDGAPSATNPSMTQKADDRRA